uniref:Uncharacterized protein n=1 Tax=Arundo donax TaxID=35708 RepID=A0A0A9AKC4_ARUDO
MTVYKVEGEHDAEDTPEESIAM